MANHHSSSVIHPHYPFDTWEPSSTNDRDDEEHDKTWQIIPPIVTGGRIPVVRTYASPHAGGASTARQNVSLKRSQIASGSTQETAPLFEVNFYGPDQRWYSVSARVKDRPPRQPEPPPVLHPSWQRQVPPDEQSERDTDGYRSIQAPPRAQTQTDANSTSRDFLLQVVQPALAGLMDGSVSTLAPIFAVAFATHQSFTTFLVGMASALGAGISMAFSEALSDDGEFTGRGSPLVRGGITGGMTFLGGALHTLPFLIPNVQLALVMAYVVVAIELFAIAAIRHRFFGTRWWLSIVQVVGGGILVFLAAMLLGNA